MEQQTELTHVDDTGQAQEIGRRTDRPAVAVVAKPDNAEDVAATILRGHREGFDTIVCHGGDESLEAISFARQLDVPTVEIDLHQADGASFTEAVMQEAQNLGHPGVLWHECPQRQIDFEASTQRLREDEMYLAEAVPVSRVDSGLEVLVAIPAYNEESSIAEVVRDSLPHADEVVVVDDGSSDDTVRLAEEAGATVIQHDANRGYGGALKTAFTEASRCHAEHLVVLDGDGQHDPSDIVTLVTAQQDTGSEIVIGSRSVSGSETDMPLYRRFGFGVVNILTNLSMGVARSRSRVADTQSGFRVYNSTAISSLADEDIGDNMSASTDILHHAHRQDYSILEVGTTVSYDVEESSSHHPLSHGLQLVSNLLRTIERDRPVSLIGVPGFLSALAGLGFGYWTISNYVASGTFPLGIALLSGFCGLVGVLACFTAIILHSLEVHVYGSHQTTSRVK
jgi:hypothetical protein